jgi:hypothetical protein
MRAAFMSTLSLSESPRPDKASQRPSSHRSARRRAVLREAALLSRRWVLLHQAAEPGMLCNGLEVWIAERTVLSHTKTEGSHQQLDGLVTKPFGLVPLFRLELTYSP